MLAPLMAKWTEVNKSLRQEPQLRLDSPAVHLVHCCRQYETDLRSSTAYKRGF